MFIVRSFIAVLMTVSLTACFDSSTPLKISESGILKMRVKGLIVDATEFTKNLRKYAKDKKIKGILIQIDSPGGLVGPTQEIYSEILRVKEKHKKPVVVSCASLAASGGYYIAVAADKIIANPGAILGSIGVMMEFANMSGLYRWAKVQPFILKSGQFKDSGAPHRAMTKKERAYFQSMIDELYAQFRTTVTQRRKLSRAVVAQYTDGRVFTGAKAVRLGFADQVGSLTVALEVLGELSGLGKDPKVFEIPEKKTGFFSFLSNIDASHLFGKVFNSQQWLPQRFRWMGRPLLLWPNWVE